MAIPPSRRTFLVGVGATVLADGGVCAVQERPVAVTRQGRVAGFRRDGASVFLGIPYGAPTGGARRFLPPQPAKSWSGIRDASRLGQRSPQPPGHIYDSPLIGPYMTGGRQAELIAMNEPEGEDCLVLNVLTSAPDNRKRPVMVYIHGGGFASGSGAVMALSDRLVTEQDVVLVTVNHRLGPLGFLYLGGLSSQYARGNPGLLDLVAALEWVRANIARFGGDPAKVTIFGESGGAAKVALLCAMPQARGLFRGAIMESGLLPEPVARSVADETTRRIAGRLGAAPSPLAALLTSNTADLVRLAPNAGPVADTAVLTKDPWLKAPATVNNVPMIIGYCADEASLFYGMSDPATFALDWQSLVPTLTKYLPLDGDRLSPIVAAYRDARPQSSASDVFFRLVSDATFARGMIRMADLKAAQSASVYLYRNNYDTMIPPGLRAFHTAELPLIGRLVLQPRAEVLSRRLSAAWASFARVGQPQASGLAPWQPHAAGGDAIMMFDERSSFGRDPEAGAQRRLFASLGSAAVPFAPAARH